MNFHPSAVKLIVGKSYREARQILRSFGCTHSEQSQIIRAAKHDWYQEGIKDGAATIYNRGGTQGAIWHADQLKLIGHKRTEYINGFNQGLDEQYEML